MTDAQRFCPTGNHFRRIIYFRVGTNGKVVRDCMDCERIRKQKPKTIVPVRTDGVDIDAIHWKLGAVRVGYKK